MSRIRLDIDRLVLRGFEPLEAKAFSEALQSHLSEILSEQATRTHWAGLQRTPVLKLGRMSRDSGIAGARKFGKQVARAVGKGLRP
jgi:hypothetical protein